MWYNYSNQCFASFTMHFAEMIQGFNCSHPRELPFTMCKPSCESFCYKSSLYMPLYGYKDRDIEQKKNKNRIGKDVVSLKIFFSFLLGPK